MTGSAARSMRVRVESLSILLLAPVLAFLLIEGCIASRSSDGSFVGFLFLATVWSAGLVVDSVSVS